MTSVAATPARGRGLAQWAGLGGIVYVVLFIVGNIVAFSGQPDTGGPPGEIVRYYRDSGNRDQVVAGWFLVLVGVFFLLWFLASLRIFMRRIDADGFLTSLATVGGAVYASLALVGIGLQTAVKTMSDDTFQHQVYPGLIHAADDAGYVLHATGGAGAAALMIAATLAAWRAGRVPAWAGWAGVVAGVLAIFSIFFFPQILIALWLLVAGWLLFSAR